VSGSHNAECAAAIVASLKLDNSHIGFVVRPKFPAWSRSHIGLAGYPEFLAWSRSPVGAGLPAMAVFQALFLVP
jgi:hypothetical protein